MTWTERGINWKKEREETSRKNEIPKQKHVEKKEETGGEMEKFDEKTVKKEVEKGRVA